jgi:excisionase family DNA binding protein
MPWAALLKCYGRKRSFPMLTPKGLACLLNMPLSWIYEQTRRGGIPGFKVGKYWRFKEVEVLEWFEKFRRGPEPPNGNNQRRQDRDQARAAQRNMPADQS